MQQVSIGCGMLSLFFLITVDPHLSRLFFALEDIIQVVYLVSQLLLSDLKLTFYACFFNFQVFISSF